MAYCKLEWQTLDKEWHYLNCGWKDREEWSNFLMKKHREGHIIQWDIKIIEKEK